MPDGEEYIAESLSLRCNDRRVTTIISRTRFKNSWRGERGLVVIADMLEALRAFRDLLGDEHVLTDDAALTAAATATFATTQRIPSIIRPGTREDVQACLRIANHYLVPLYPISRGKNWGWGSRVPPHDGSILLELQRLDRILAYDEHLAYVTVQPGVTFSQLSHFLREQDSELMLNITGGTPEASVVGNMMERGQGRTPYGDRFSHVCNLEVVLPLGDCIHTGYGRWRNAQAAPAYRWGVGPSLDGLFTQSNLGVVTAMTLWLPPMPASVQTCFFAIEDTVRLAPLIDTLQELKIHGLLPASPVLVSPYTSLATITQYPWALVDAPPLPVGYLARLREAMPSTAWRFSPWTGHTALYARDRETGRAMRETIARRLKPHVDTLVFHDGSEVDIWTGPAEMAENALLRALDPQRAGYTGVPPSHGPLSPYWRKRRPPSSPVDPDRDQCGVIWCSVTVPFLGASVAEAVAVQTEIMTQHALEPLISITCITERAVYVTAMLVYDRDTPGEDERAMVCHDTMLDQLIARGYYPRRLGVQSMTSLPPSQDATDELLTILKHALDPNGILAPGRYLPTARTRGHDA